ncbi:secreted protein [hydrothermal vent metagenome]|uniref:Secreted protein n=1 Tax=hydrothermal vent metagenome TaxID=652676 RepID=A0A3B0YEF7_9ZZZZ
MQKLCSGNTKVLACTIPLLLLSISRPAVAHDPVFGLGPHVLFKGGVEIAPEVFINQSADKKATELGLELTYGLTGDWSAGAIIPYENNSDTSGSVSGQGDLTLFTKYRFWRQDGPGVQQSVSFSAKLKTDTGNKDVSTGTTDGILGLTYGYEGRKWYRWSALRYRYNDTNADGLKRGNKILFDLVGGIRLKQTKYTEPDTVWLLELNGESTDNTELNNAALINSGGTEWFVSPGIFWTKRNFAVKAGVQIPFADNLNGNQQQTDYRAKLVLEWHL